MNELENWFSIFWDTFPSDLCHRKKGSRKVAYQAIVKLNPDKELQSKILGNMRELIRYDRLQLKAGQKVDRWCFVSTWINQERWETLTDIGSYSDVHDKIAGRKCACGNEVGHVNQCWKCYSEEHPNPYEEYLKAESKRIGMWKKPDESLQEWRDRNREWSVKSRRVASLRR